MNLGLRHLALHVINLEQTVAFYVEHFGMQVIWQPDADNYYLTSGKDSDGNDLDNLALHRAKPGMEFAKGQHLDHLGFFLQSHAEIDQWYQRFLQAEVEIAKEVKTHRDGARSFYVRDPDGNVIQIIAM